MAGPTERYEILKHIVGEPPAVSDVVQIDPSIGGAAPAAAIAVAFDHLPAKRVWQAFVFGHLSPPNGDLVLPLVILFLAAPDVVAAIDYQGSGCIALQPKRALDVGSDLERRMESGGPKCLVHEILARTLLRTPSSNSSTCSKSYSSLSAGADSENDMCPPSGR